MYDRGGLSVWIWAGVVGGWSLLVWLGGLTPPKTHAENWRLRQTNQRRQREALKRLEQQPFSGLAFEALWRASQKKAAQIRTEKALRQGLKKQPQAWWRWVVWGRWNMVQKRCGEALAAWEKAENYRADWRICQGKARAWTCAGEKQRGLEQSRKCLSQVPAGEREKAYQEVMRMAIQLRENKALADLMRGVVVGRWSRNALLSMARHLLNSGYASYALRVYEVMLQQGKTHSTKDWKEASEAALHAGAIGQAKTYLANAYKSPQGPSWWMWELYGLEERIARRGGDLRGLYTQRKTTWGPSKATDQARRWDWLARISTELGNREDAALWDRQILSVHPQDVQALLRRLRDAQQRGDQTITLQQYDALLQSKRAEPAHIVFYVEALSKRSGRPRLGRWKASWATLYRGLLCYHRQPSLWMHYSTEEHFGEACYRSSEDDWVEYRQRRWDFWWRYEAKEPQKQDIQRARHVLLAAVRQYNGSLEALRVFEPWLVWLGEDATASKTRNRMIALSAGDAEAFVWLEKMFREMGDHARWDALVKLHLGDSRWNLRQFGALLFHLAQVWAEQETTARLNRATARWFERFDTPRSKKSAPSRTASPTWSRVPCDRLLRAIERHSAAIAQTSAQMQRRSSLRPLPSDSPPPNPTLMAAPPPPTHHFNGFSETEKGLWRVLVPYTACGAKTAPSKLRDRLESLGWDAQQRTWLLHTYAQMGDIEGVRRLHKKAPDQASYWEKWLAERTPSASPPP